MTERLEMYTQFAVLACGAIILWSVGWVMLFGKPKRHGRDFGEGEGC